MTATVKHLTAFQRDILFVISSIDTPYGLGIKNELEQYYEEEVNTGRVYQNLNTLVAGGYLDKSDIDKRTNSYRLTERGVTAIENRLDWQETQAAEQLIE